MTNIKELCVDNIVFYKDKKGQISPCIIQNIYNDSNMVKLKWVENTETDNGFLTDIKNVEPIEITIGFLGNNDFHIDLNMINGKAHYRCVYNKDFIEVVTSIVDSNYEELKFATFNIKPMCFSENRSMTHLKYIHQLQNMFTLNGIKKEWTL